MRECHWVFEVRVLDHRSSIYRMVGCSLRIRLRFLSKKKKNSFALRKPSRTLSGSKEKEPYLPFIKVIKLSLVIIVILFLTSGFLTSGREVASEILGTDGWFGNKKFHVPAIRPSKEEGTTYNSLKVNILTVCFENSGYSLPVAHDSAATLAMQTPVILSHPCKSLAFPPPRAGAARRIGPRSCPVCYIPVKQAVASMPRFASASPVLHHSAYIREENPIKTEPHGGSDFGGYPSLKQGNDYFIVDKSMAVHRGFIKGCRAGDHTGFDIGVDDRREMDEFHEIIVASAIFGNYDVIQQPMDISENA